MQRPGQQDERRCDSSAEPGQPMVELIDVAKYFMSRALAQRVLERQGAAAASVDGVTLSIHPARRWRSSANRGGKSTIARMIVASTRRRGCHPLRRLSNER